MRRIMCPSTSSMSCKDEVEIRRKVIDKPMGPFESFHALHCISTLPALTEDISMYSSPSTIKSGMWVIISRQKYFMSKTKHGK